jgi:excisionase family DNA binding protein
MLITVPEASRRIGRNAETIRRWIRSGRLRAERVGTQHMIDEAALDEFVNEPTPASVPAEWQRFPDGEPQPDWAAVVRRSRSSH